MAADRTIFFGLGAQKAGTCWLHRMQPRHADLGFAFLMRNPVARLWSGGKHRIRVSGVAPEDRQSKATAALREALDDTYRMAADRFGDQLPEKWRDR